MTTNRSNRGVLALVGGGEFTDGSATFNHELLASSGGTDVLLITAGAAFENPNGIVAAASTHFDTMGATVRALPVANRRDANDDTIVRTAKAAQFIYISDGSAMHLRSVLKDTQLFDVIVAAYRGGAVLAASGAGATVICDPMIDPRGGAYTVGLGVVEHLAVYPHHTSVEDHLWLRAVDLLTTDATLVGIDNETALIRDATGAWRVGGGGNVTMLNNGSQNVVGAGPITMP